MADTTPDLLTALNRIATALEALAKVNAPQPTAPENRPYTSQAYPSHARRLAIVMHDEGKTLRQIHAELVSVCGRSPSLTHLPRLLPKWRKAEGREG